MRMAMTDHPRQGGTRHRQSFQHRLVVNQEVVGIALHYFQVELSDGGLHGIENVLYGCRIGIDSGLGIFHEVSLSREATGIRRLG